MTTTAFHQAALRNRIHSLVLLGAMTALLAALGWSLAGLAGIILAAALGAAGMLAGRRASAILLLRMHRARRIEPGEAPLLWDMVAELAGRARLERGPALFHIPSPAMQAFSLEVPGGTAIAVTDGLLRNMSTRELAAVLAHEISHIASRDVRLMTLADLAARVTRSLAFAGWMLVIVSLPLALAGQPVISWLTLVLLVSGPTVSGLMQFGLSRAREYDADLGAVALCGDPEALASALARLEAYQGRLWEQMLLPGYRLPEPSLLRTHPETGERVRRIRHLPEGRRLRALDAARPVLGTDVPRPWRRVRWRPWGVWR